LCIERFASDLFLHDEISRNASEFFNKYGDADRIYAEYAKFVERVGEKGLTQRRKDAKVGDVADRLFGSLQVDSSKARDLLGWEPVVSMDDALTETARAHLSEKGK
jgi:nucleoside-diphosphate-sugar epimerase